MATVAYEKVTKRFDGTVAVSDFSLEIADGEFLVLVGPSGCGKSTALRMLAGLEEVTSGRILIGDQVVNNVAPVARNVAMVFQSYALYPHMSVYENMAFALRNARLPKTEIDRRVRATAAILQLEPLLKRKPKQLSGGQRQRVALGRAIVREPSVYLMDEPLSNLDAALRVATRAEILKLQNRIGTTTIYVTHDQVEAMTMGDRIAVMSEGVLQQVGRPEDLYTAPRNVFVAGFIGSPAMNLAAADVRGASLARNGFELIVPERLASLLRDRGHGAVIAGFRPQDLRVATGGPTAAEAHVAAVVDVVEYLGDERLVHLTAGELPILALLPADLRPHPGERIELALPVERLHLFDPETELRVPTA